MFDETLTAAGHGAAVAAYEANQFATGAATKARDLARKSKGATMVTMCKSSARAVRRGLGTTEEGPLTKVSVVLKQPELLDALQSDADFERFQATSERLQQALSAADAAAFYSASGDFSAQVPPRPVCIARVLPNIAHAPHSFCADDIQARRDAQHA